MTIGGAAPGRSVGFSREGNGDAGSVLAHPAASISSALREGRDAGSARAASAISDAVRGVSAARSRSMSASSSIGGRGTVRAGATR